MAERDDADLSPFVIGFEVEVDFDCPECGERNVIKTDGETFGSKIPFTCSTCGCEGAFGIGLRPDDSDS